MSLVAKFLQQITWLRRSAMIRLAFLLSVIFAGGMAVAIFVALELGQRAIADRLDTSLESLAAATVIDTARSTGSSLILRPLNDLADLPQPFQRATDRGGRTVSLARDFQGADIWRVLVTQDAGGAQIMLAVPLEDSEDARELLAGVLWTTTALVIGVSLLIGLFAGLLAQRRLARIDTTLARLAAGDLAARTGHVRSRDDLDDIARQLDLTARELESLVAQTRHLSASLAHDLRTPLARLRSRLEALPEGTARADALEEAQRLSDIFDTIMRVARIEAAQGQEGFEPVDFGGLVTELHDIFGPVVEDAGKTLVLDVAAPGQTRADRQMLVQAMANLIQNAIVHGGEVITLVARADEVGVSDNGPGTDPAQYGEIIKPMVRLDAARSTDGSGLGLALVRAVADRHGATLQIRPLSAGADRAGLRVTIKFADL